MLIQGMDHDNPHGGGQTGEDIPIVDFQFFHRMFLRSSVQNEISEMATERSNT